MPEKKKQKQKRPWGYVTCRDVEKRLLSIPVATKAEAAAVLDNARSRRWIRGRVLTGLAEGAVLVTRADDPALFE